MGLAVILLVLAGVYILLKSQANNVAAPAAVAPAIDRLSHSPQPSPIVPQPSAPATPALGSTTPTSTKMIYRGTGKVIDGSHFVKDEQRCWKMQSGGCHPSSRFEVGGTGKSSHFCVPYKDLEATIYVKIGPPIPCQKGGSSCSYIELGTGGPGQSDNNCCCYHLGFRADGAAWGEEEGPHNPKVVAGKLTISGGQISNIGSIYNRTIGLKTILWHDSGGVQLEGWVDAKANGQWQRFYKATNPSAGGLPVITHFPIQGTSNPQCQEVRLRLDGSWPNDFIPAMTSVQELVVPVQTSNGVPAPVVPASNPVAKSIMAKKPKVKTSGATKGSSNTVPIGKAGMAKHYTML